MFEELKKLKGKHNNFSTKIDGNSTPEEIADHFGETYKELYNRTGSKEPMINLFSEVHDKIGESDQDDISKVNTDLISRIIKEKMKQDLGFLKITEVSSREVLDGLLEGNFKSFN